MNEIRVFEVEMRIFGKGAIRMVPIPQSELSDDVEANLQKIYYHGQNEIRPTNLPSVSPGDVIRYKGDRYLVTGMGFRKLGLNECTKVLTDVDEIADEAIKAALEN